MMSLAVGAVCFFVAPKSLAAASTDPIRSTGTRPSVNQPETVHPIYYPISIAPEGRDEGVTPETILRMFMERHTAMDYPGSAELALRLITLIPDRPEGHYNLACALTRLQRHDEALNSLAKAIECGWRDLAHLQLDPDLKPLHASEQFKRLSESLKATIENERGVPTNLRQEPVEVVVDDLQKQIPSLIARHHVPGASVALVRGGEVVWSSSFGIADRRSPGLLTDSNRFRVRAPLHLLAIIAAGQQEQLGRLQLAKLLVDGSALDESPRASADRSTARPTGDMASPVNSTSRDATTTKQNGRKHCVDNRQPNYSSNGVYGFIRLATEMSTNQSFADYCEQEILAPLDMEESGFNPTPASDDDHGIAIGHSKLGSPMNPAPQAEELFRGGALYTTAGDLAKLMLEIMRDGEPVDSIVANQPDRQDQARSARPLAVNRSMGTVCSPAVFSLVSKVNDEVPRGLGLALDVRKTEHGTRVQVADLVSGIGCLMRWYPENKSGIVVLYNSETGRQAAECIAQIALGGE